MSRTIRPQHDRVVIHPRDPEKISRGGILLPDAVKAPIYAGTVVAVGPGRINDRGELVPMQTRVGDTVVFNAHMGLMLDIDGVVNLVISDDAVLGVLEGAQD